MFTRNSGNQNSQTLQTSILHVLYIQEFFIYRKNHVILVIFLVSNFVIQDLMCLSEYKIPVTKSLSCKADSLPTIFSNKKKSESKILIQNTEKLLLIQMLIKLFQCRKQQRFSNSTLQSQFKKVLIVTNRNYIQ